MSDLSLGVGDASMQFSYLGRKLEGQGTAHVTIPEVCTTVEMGGDHDLAQVEEGIAFSPVYHIRLRKTITKGAVRTWLKLQKAN